MEIRDIYFFKNLEIDIINNIEENSKTITVPAETEIIRQGDKSNNNAYIIKEGLAHVVIDGRNIKTLKQGDIFGEMSLITNEKRTATIKAITNLNLLVINKDLLLDIIKKFPNGGKFQKIIMKRIKENLLN